MLGWIVKTECTETAGMTGDLLGCNGKTYNFATDEIKMDSASLRQELPVLFTPVEDAGGCSFIAREIRPAPSRLLQVNDRVEQLRARVRASLSNKRYQHSFRVAKILCALAEANGVKQETAEIAGLLHDIAKEHTNEQNLEIIRNSGLPFPDFEARYHHFLHAAAGEVTAREQFGITDEDILGAIRNHNGRPAMRPLEKMIFLADHMDHMYRKGLNFSRVLDEADIESSLRLLIREINHLYDVLRQTPDTLTACTINYVMMDRSKTQIRQDTGIPDDLFDRLLQVHARQALSLKSLTNARELGGYEAADGRRIRKGMLMRSARVDHLTPEDAGKLHDLGVDTIIDLRSEGEQLETPKNEHAVFRYVHAPIPFIDENDYQREVAEKFYLTADDNEQTYYVSAYLGQMNMSALYMDTLLQPESVRQLRLVFDTLLDERCRGALICGYGGKDRTGIASALLLAALGVKIEDIRYDYYASLIATFAMTESFAETMRRQGYDVSYINQMRSYTGLELNLAEQVYAQLLDEYDSVEQYLAKTLLLTPERNSALRRKYLV